MSLDENRSDVRGFVHKRIGGAFKGAVGGLLGGGPGGILGGAVGGFIGGGVPARITPAQQRFDARKAAERAAMGLAPIAPFRERFGTTACPPGFNPGPGGCVAAVGRVPGLEGFVQRVIPGGATGFEVTAPAIMPSPQIGTQAPGLATLGRFGAAVEPTTRMQDIRECPRGMVLAVDSLCYSRRDVRNSERFWPRGRRPLLTGGEMRAISTAASAARKLQRKQKDLQELGLLPKPTARRKKTVVAGHKTTLAHA